jgi:hypothetical protein
MEGSDTRPVASPHGLDSVSVRRTDEEVTMESNDVKESRKKPYLTPKLIVHGTVEKITAAEEPPAEGKQKPGGQDVFGRQPQS